MTACNLPAGRIRLLPGAILAIVVAACGRGDSPLEIIDPDAAPAAPTYEQVRVILDRRCVPCHGGGTATVLDDDSDFPDYSTCEGTLAGVRGLLETVLERGSMPPGASPRLAEEEKLLLKRWIFDRGACAPCGNPCP